MDIHRNLSKLNVIEHEFRQAEKVELVRQKEEEYMRVRDHYPFLSQTDLDNKIKEKHIPLL